ncbi:MAG: acyl carrier protein [Beijerinckiaceae bacterium]
MSTRLTILTAIEEIAAAQKKTLAPLTDDLVLVNSGLDSLCFALLVARLEDDLGRDPFSESDDITFPVTLGEFIALYEHVRP